MRASFARGGALLVLCLSACGTADLVDEGACGPNGECPAGSTCNARGRCVRGGAALDARPPDAPLPADAIVAPSVDAPASPDGALPPDGRPDAASIDAPPPADAAIDAFVDVTGPPTVLAGTPAEGSFTSSLTAMFTFTSEAGARFRCSRDGAAFAACTSPQSYTTATTDGAHSFAVFALDALDNQGATQTRRWTLDRTLPVVTLSGTPADGATVNGRGVSFTFSSEVGATFACSRDGGAFATCTSPQTYQTPAVDGPHSFAVRATDRASNVGPDATRGWTLDSTGPTTTLAGTPAEGAATNQATNLTFSGDAVRFECSTDAGAFSACTSPVTVSFATGGSADGTHTVNVRGFDALGNPGPIATRSFVWDTVGPAIASISGGPAEGALYNNPGFLFTFTAPDAVGYECQWDALGWHSCPGQDQAPWTNVADREGPHMFQVRTLDALGNVGPIAVRHFTLDTITPSTSIDSPTPAQMDACPGTGARLGVQVISGTTIVWIFSSDDPNATFLCFLESPNAVGMPCSSPFTFPNNGLGAHQINVRAVDAANNQTNPFPGRGWTVVNTCPN